MFMSERSRRAKLSLLHTRAYMAGTLTRAQMRQITIARYSGRLLERNAAGRESGELRGIATHLLLATSSDFFMSLTRRKKSIGLESEA
jgi:hypothetical protein